MSLSLDLALNRHAEHRLFLFLPSLASSRRCPRAKGHSRVSCTLSALLIAVFTALFALFVPSTFGQQDSAASPPQAGSSTQTYQPKFPGDPARSDSEAAALAYMRVVIRAQRRFNKQYGHFATSLAELVHSGTFTKRMVNPERGDYTAGFKGKKDSFVLTMTPKNMDAQHRSFYAEDDGKIHADETKAADASSPGVK
jgi:hypothetical protein